VLGRMVCTPAGDEVIGSSENASGSIGEELD
jgi:hypothetical protein